MTTQAVVSQANLERRRSNDRRGQGNPHAPDPRLKLGETDNWVLYLDKDQSLIGKCVLALKRPETDVMALSDGELSELWELTRYIKKVVDYLFTPEHYNYAFLMNHWEQVHLTVSPRYKQRREWAGGTYVDPEFGRAPATRLLEDTAYEAILSAMRERLSK